VELRATSACGEREQKTNENRDPTKDPDQPVDDVPKGQIDGIQTENFARRHEIPLSRVANAAMIPAIEQK